MAMNIFCIFLVDILKIVAFDKIEVNTHQTDNKDLSNISKLLLIHIKAQYILIILL